VLLYCTTTQLNVSQYLYNHGDYESMKHELLNTDWEQVFESLNMQSMWSTFQIHSIASFLSKIQVAQFIYFKTYHAKAQGMECIQSYTPSRLYIPSIEMQQPLL